MLVDYNSDSDSDSAATAPAPAPASAGPASKLKPGSLIQKDSTGVRKIVVQLPDASTVDADEPPTKRARVGGGGLSGLSALLPAPKRSGANTPLVSMKNSEGVGRVLGGGAARKEDEFLVVMPEENQGPEEEPPIASSPKEKEEERKAAPVSVATTTQFIPQSVSRKPIQPASAFRRKGATKTTSPASATLAAKPAKVSLFGSAPEVTSSTSNTNRIAKASEYKPLLVNTPKPPPKAAPEPTPDEEINDNGNPYYEDNAHDTNQFRNQPFSGPQDLESVAKSIGLDDAAMRQLRGRNARSGPINIVDFNVEQEYNINEQNRALGLTLPQANPLRSIAPGKHQLSSLLNAAQSQKTALEEHFAEGKRNKKEAGSKYGW